jgi:hypothetical protein
VRALAFDGDRAPDYTGVVVWRALLDRPPEVDAFHLYNAPRATCGLCPVSEAQLYMFAVEPQPEVARVEAEREPEPMRGLLRDFGGLAGVLRDRIVDPAQVVRRPVEAILVPPPWNAGRVVLVGDAVHAPPPTLAAGAAIALEDAVVLDEMLAGPSGEGVEPCSPRSPRAAGSAAGSSSSSRWRAPRGSSARRRTSTSRRSSAASGASWRSRIEPGGGIIAAMASAENVAAGARAVFFSVAYPDPKDGFATQDAASVFAQLEGLFHAARAIADPGWLGAAAEAADGAADPPAPKPSQEPLVRRIHMDWRHMEVAAELPWEFIVGGGLVGLVTMTKGVAGAPPTLQVAISQLAAEQADWEQRRTPAERAVIEQVTNAVLERSRLRPSYTRIYLGEEDEFEGWTA